jgi:hypothetical protein
MVERLNCEEKLALMRAYAKATRAYSQAVAQLGRALALSYTPNMNWYNAKHG